LAYARAISTTGRGEFLEAIIDDGINLPAELPADPHRQPQVIRVRPKSTGQEKKRF
jgi:hypothetical protein